MKADELEEAEDAFSLAIECRKRRVRGKAPSTADGTDTRMQAAHHRERGRVRQLLRDFDGARQVRERKNAGQLHLCARRGASTSCITRCRSNFAHGYSMYACPSPSVFQRAAKQRHRRLTGAYYNTFAKFNP